MAMGMPNCPVNPTGSVSQKSARILTEYGIIQCEKIMKYLILNTNNIALRIIARANNSDLHHRPGEMY
jgi:hypothetical protein